MNGRDRGRAWRHVGVLLALVFAVAAAGCGDDENKTTINEKDGSTFTLRLLGQVVNETTGAPVAGATFSACGFGSTTTDGNGQFVLDIELLLGLATPTGVLQREQSNGSVSGYQALFLSIAGPGLATKEFWVGFDGADLAALTGNSEEDPRLEAGVCCIPDTVVTAWVTERGLWDPGDQGGLITLHPGEDLSVVVTQDGNPIGQGTWVFAYQEAGTGPCRNIIRAQTDTNSTATLMELDPTEDYTIIVPAQADHDSESQDHYSIHSYGDVLAMNVNTASFSNSVYTISTGMVSFPSSVSFLSGPITDTTSTTDSYGTNFDSNTGMGAIGARDLSAFDDGDESTTSLAQSVISANGAVTVVFRYPVLVVQGTPGLEPQFDYRNNLVDPSTTSTPGYDADSPSDPAEFTVIDATATDVLSGTVGSGTVWTIAPATTLPDNEVITLRFFARTENGTDVENYAWTFYRPVINTAIAEPTLDNYNGRTNSTSSTFAYLEFTEIVTGHYKILEIVEDGTTTTFQPGSGSQVPLLASSTRDSMVFNAANAGASAVGDLGVGIGIFYRVLLTDPRDSSILQLDDDDEITILLSVWDAEGNRYDDVITLEVQ